MKLEFAGKSGRPLKISAEHSHKHWELVYNEAGEGFTRFGGKTFPFKKGTILLYPPETPHYKEAEDLFEDYYLFISDLSLPEGIYCFADTQGQAIAQLLRIIYQCYHETKQQPVCESLLEAVMGLLVPEEKNMDKNVRQLRHILASRFADPEFRVADAMKTIPLHEDHLRRCFKKEVGMTPQEYLNHLRIENAKKLISQAQMRLSEVAYQSGFYDPLYFSRVFHKQTGLSPRAWAAQQ